MLADLESDMRSVSLGSCSDEELKGLVQRALGGRQVIDGFVNRLTAEARRREATGSGTPAEEIIRSDGKISQREAKTLDRRAGVGEVLPEVGDAVDQGAARSENADTLARQLEKLTDTQRAALAGIDGEIARQAASAPPETFARWLGRRVRAITEATPVEGETREERQRAASAFGMKRRGDGMWDLYGSLDQTRGAELYDVITRTARRLNDGEATANARADALHRLTTRRPATQSTGTSNTRSTGNTAGRSRGQPGDNGAGSWYLLDGFDPGANMGIGYIVDAATLIGGPHPGSVAQTWAGNDIDPAEIDCLACDTDLYAILYDELGQPTTVGCTHRAATKEQRLQLRGLYDRCPLDGTPFGDCDIHHVNLPWEDGGETELHNLLPISRAWHQRVHHRGWRLKMSPDRSLKLWRPDGQLHRAIPPPTPITRE